MYVLYVKVKNDQVSLGIFMLSKTIFGKKECLWFLKYDVLHRKESGYPYRDFASHLNGELEPD